MVGGLRKTYHNFNLLPSYLPTFRPSCFSVFPHHHRCLPLGTKVHICDFETALFHVRHDLGEPAELFTVAAAADLEFMLRINTRSRPRESRP